MTIKSEDIKLLQSQVLLDTDEGGGQMTGKEIIDGLSNNLFADVSELDRTYGRISMRKSYAAILTPDTDSYYGAHAIITRPPIDPNVSVSMFTTRDWFDTRTKARDVVERYLARGPKWAGHLLEKQLVGQRAIQICMFPSDPEPKIGQGLSLIQDEDKATEFEQYVRITKISSVERLFLIDGKTEIRKVLTLEITDPLRYTFEGITPQDFKANSTARAQVRDTRIADAATYYGLSQLLAPALRNTRSIQVNSIFTQLIPSAQKEVGLADLTAASQLGVYLNGSTAEVTTNYPFLNWGSNINIYLGLGVTPGSLKLYAGSPIVDDGQGKLMSTSNLQIGTIEYDKGLLKFNSSFWAGSGGATAKFIPAVKATRVADTACIAITQENRGYVYTITLLPIPAPQTLVVSYMAQGKVYYLYDIGNGELRGADVAFGVGTINYITGTVILTLQTYPEADSDIIFSWGKQVSSFTRADLVVAPSKFNITLTNQGIVPGSVTLKWKVAGVDKTAKDTGAAGLISGDVTGTINYASGVIDLTPSVLMQNGTSVTATYQFGTAKEKTFSAPTRNAQGQIILTLPNEGGAVIQKSVELEYNVDILDSNELGTTTETLSDFQPPPNFWSRDPLVQVFDDGNGALKRNDGIVVKDGAIDYAARVITFNPEYQVSIPKPKWGWVPIGQERVAVAGGQTALKTTNRYQLTGWQYVPTLATMPIENGYVKIKWRATADANTITETFQVGKPRFDLTPGYVETIVQGSVAFKVGTRRYIDRAGVLYHSVNPATGSGVQGGTVQYATGIVSLDDWEPGVPNTLTLESLVTEMGVEPVDSVVFRTPVTPLRPSSIEIRAVPIAGNSGQQVVAKPDAQGRFSTPWVQGTVDYTSGVVRLAFGTIITVTPADKVQPWFDQNQVFIVGGVEKFFRAKPVYADSIRYNATGYSYLPLNADTLGLDPVRLPFDGKVPIYRVSEVVVIHNTETTPFPSNAGVGAMLDVGRARLSYAKVYDQNGLELDTDMYKVDLDAGVVTLKNNFSLGALVPPLKAEHRIEDMGVITDVQINGMLTLNIALSHDFPAKTSYASSALIIRDMQSRVFNKFSQESWTNIWSDSRIGNIIIGQYNDVLYPIEVTNKGATTERWMLIFTSVTSFRIIGQNLGQIGVGDIGSDTAPINPATGVPYFRLKAGGWGSGWSAGNVLRFNTAGANFPIWLVRTVLQGDSSVINDSFQVQIRGDINR